MNKTHLQGLTDQINSLPPESLAEFLEELSPLVQLIQDQKNILRSRQQEEAKIKSQARLEELLARTKYLEPTYPEMGVAGVMGSCYFSQEDEATELIKTLINQSYYYGHQKHCW